MTRTDLRTALEWANEERDRLQSERDEARAEVQDYREQLRKLPDANRVASQDAFRRGAEAMRGACASAMHPIMRSMISRTEAAQTIRALPIPGEP